ncbi:MAG: 16S rRNA (cytidine(1402)-2'-O)-methyltransferase [Alphaproteobacteria bacterium]|nr:16S rRNA (cytidine(1402)-2'-O)-methyltransferase [Alphaproteobacteria bacterium]
MSSGKKYKGEAGKKQASAGLVGRSAEASRKNIQGQLTLVATPIGNSADISLRALDTLRNAELIFCEDTRQTQKLLMMHGITGKKLVAAHQHNEAAAAQKILAEIDAGKSVVYVSDAGLPLISDPGETIMHAAIDAGAKVTSIPGANAALTALQLSGLPPLPFYFAGFLPPKTKARKDVLKLLQSIPATLVFYEAPHRLAETLADMLSVLGNRNAAYARELTKMYEEVRRGTLSQLSKHTEAQETIRGECVICIAPPAQETAQNNDADETDKLLLAALKTLSPRDAAFDVAAKTGLQRRTLYQRILELKNNAGTVAGSECK